MPYKDLEKRNLSSAKRRAALGKACPPEGFAPVRVTNDGQGLVRAVRSIPEGDEKHVSPIVLEGHEVKFVTTHLNSEGGIISQYVRGEPKAQAQRALLEAIDRHFDKLESRVRLPEPIELQCYPCTRQLDDTQVTMLLGDPHIGMLSWHLETGTDFDLRIAERQMNMAVDLLISRSPRAAQFVLANLGDFFHAEDEKQVTPRGGNKLDVDGRTGKILDIGFGCLERAIEQGLLKYPVVKVICLPGNHDPRLSRVLARWLRSRFRNEPRVEILSNDDPFTFQSWGNNLHMFYHGHDAKVDDLPSIMSSYKEGRPWGEHPYRMIYTGHIHHLQRKEFRGCMWESSRTMAPGDYWHHAEGYRAGRGMRTVTHNKQFGHIREDVIGAREVELALDLVA